MPLTTNKADYEIELRNLSILNHLKHPHIIEVLSAFTYRDRHNLIFPAMGGDLATLLESERPPDFERDQTFVAALADLASAIEQVHNLTANTIDLQRIGCHHDLRPKNILIEGHNFILADFGLSRFKNPSQDSDTMHKQGQGDYVAPECEDLNGDFDKRRIRRSSDIWSFGCIIAEVLTYMMRGKDGVDAFWELRSHKVGQNKYHLFHQGPDRQSHVVEEWLSGLATQCAKAGRLLLQLIKAMMCIEPRKRPTAEVVAARLRLIVLYYTTESIDEAYDELYSRVEGSQSAVEVYIERARYSSWKEACEITDTEDLGQLKKGFDLDLQAPLEILARIKEELEGIIPICDQPRHLLFLPLRHLNNRLVALLPVSSRDSMQTHLERNIVGKTEDPRILKGAQHTFETDIVNKSVGALASIKRMTYLLEKYEDQKRLDLYIDSENVIQRNQIADCTLGEIKKQEGEQSHPVLIEWMRYETPLVNEQEGKQRLARLDGIADFLNSTEQSAELRTLHCSSYFHEPANMRFGLVFDFPNLSPANRGLGELEVYTLGHVLETTRHRKSVPHLGDRFKLAAKLARSIAGFHKANWLHKRISSFHVIFFPPPGVSAIRCLTQPCIIGINHSRPGDEFEWTFGPASTEEGAYLDFQHPEYLKHPQRYRPEFDYYSLGLVLLEVGLWAPLSAVTKDWRGFSPEEVREKLLTDVVPSLCRTIGHRYFSVVDACLRDGFVAGAAGHLSQESQEGRLARQIRFDEVVIGQLAKCSA